MPLSLDTDSISSFENEIAGLASSPQTAEFEDLNGNIVQPI